MVPLSRLIGQNGEQEDGDIQQPLGGSVTQSEGTTARTIKMFRRQHVLFSVPLGNTVDVEATRTEINMA